MTKPPSVVKYTSLPIPVVSDTPPKVLSHSRFPKKSVFNTIVGDSHFELEFAGFLDAAVDVTSFYKNYIQLNFKMTYINHAGGISNYYPDFVVHLNNNERFIVETIFLKVYSRW